MDFGLDWRQQESTLSHAACYGGVVYQRCPKSTPSLCDPNGVLQHLWGISWFMSWGRTRVTDQLTDSCHVMETVWGRNVWEASWVQWLSASAAFELHHAEREAASSYL